MHYSYQRAKDQLLFSSIYTALPLEVSLFATISAERLTKCLCKIPELDRVLPGLCSMHVRILILTDQHDWYPKSLLSFKYQQQQSSSIYSELREINVALMFSNLRHVFIGEYFISACYRGGSVAESD